ncbi:MAG: hypothetical protein M0C28_37310 [Candidatus Moduliflexus flocculans]|nr:hypothetical protein [Candidatus Moduliflexus flocculans]
MMSQPLARDRPLRRQPLPAGHRGDRRAHRRAPGAQRHPRRRQAPRPRAGRPAPGGDARRASRSSAGSTRSKSTRRST